MIRVQIPAYTDHWMRGDRYGVVVKVTVGTRKMRGADGIYHVKLDRSGKVVRFRADDCQEVA